LFLGTHGARTADPTREPIAPTLPEPDGIMGEIVRALGEPRTGDELAESLNTDPGSVRSHLTILEIQGLIRREGSRFVRVR
ncbi:unnamed protein product, partial [Laminaria digitata]